MNCWLYATLPAGLATLTSTVAVTADWLVAEAVITTVLPAAAVVGCTTAVVVKVRVAASAVP